MKKLLFSTVLLTISGLAMASEDTTVIAQEHSSTALHRVSD
ncbi:hypothetical protein [Vibrio neonatus]|nr:hypothetical protein [Vibrio neonatus]